VLSEAFIFEETSYLVVYILGDLWLISILKLELVDEHALELLSLLDVH